MAALRPKVAALVFALAPPAAVTQQRVAPDVGCALTKGAYVCNWSSFKLVFDRAHTVAVLTGPPNHATGRATAHQAQALLAELGKLPALEGQPADLTLLLQPVEPTGVNFGPADHDLAILRLYAPNPASPLGTLLWAETLHGQGDRPWPAQVQALLRQFQDRFSAARLMRDGPP